MTEIKIKVHSEKEFWDNLLDVMTMAKTHLDLTERGLNKSGSFMNEKISNHIEIGHYQLDYFSDIVNFYRNVAEA